MYFILYRYISYFFILVSVQFVIITLFFIVKFYVFFCSYTDDFFFVLNFFFKPYYLFSLSSLFFDSCCFFDYTVFESFTLNLNQVFKSLYSSNHWFFANNLSDCLDWFCLFDGLLYVHSVSEDLFHVFFTTKVILDGDVVFTPMQRFIVVSAGEPAIVFFKLVNHSEFSFKLVSVFDVVPVHVYPYLKKIQCFCFDEILLKQGEILILPLFFVIDPLLLNDLQVTFSTIDVSYSLMRSI